MSIAYPVSIDSISKPHGSASGGTDQLNTPGVVHGSLHQDEIDAIIALETKLGINSSADTSSIDYLLKNPASNNPGHTHSISSLSGVQPIDATLTALAAFNTNGIICQTAADTFAGRSLAAPAAGFTITNPAGVAGDPTFVLADDLAALEGMAGTGLVTRTAANTYAQRTITGTSNRLSVSNGSGVAGNPTLDIDAAYVGQASITTLGTIGTGVWQGTLVALAFGGTNANLTASNGGIVYSTTTALAILAGVATNSKMLLSQNGAAPVWSTPTIPNASIASGRVWQSDGTNMVSGLIFPTPAAIAQGDLLFCSGAVTFTVLNKNASATRYLSNTGTTNNPAWAQIDLSNGVTGDLPFANLTQGSARSVLGVTGNATADVASIQGTADQTLVVNSAGTALAFGALNLAAAAAITGDLPFANLAQGSARSVLGVTGNATADVASIQGTADQTLVVNSAGTALTFGALNLSAAAAVTGSLPIANVAAGFVKVDGSTPLTASWAANNAISGVTQLDVDNLRFDGNTIISTDTNGNIILTPNGTGVTRVGGASNYWEFNSAGRATHVGTATLDIATNSYAFRSASSVLAGLKFETTGGSGFGFKDFSGVGISKSFVPVSTNDGAFDSTYGFSTPHTSPAQITANQNNYAGLNNSGFVRLDSDTTGWVITGVERPGNTLSRWTLIVYVGTSDITFAHNSASSISAYRIFTSTGANITLTQNQMALLIYDYTTAKNRIVKLP